jgi:hypothetical protein
VKCCLLADREAIFFSWLAEQVVAQAASGYPEIHSTLGRLPASKPGARRVGMATRSKSGKFYQVARAGVPFTILGAVSLSLTGWANIPAKHPAEANSAQTDSPSQSAHQDQAPQKLTTPLPRGKKLILKNGDFQLVRDYRVEGDRVRYYSVDSRQWEEMPSNLVDWDATHKIEAEEAQADKARVAKVHAREQARKGETLDIDASLEASPNVFIPPGEGAYVFEGKAVVQLVSAETDVKNDRGRTLKQVLVPIPIVPSRRHVSIQGTRAKMRISTNQPEFYVRTGDAHEPEMQLIRTKVKGYTRFIENIDTLFKEETAKAETLPMQRWLIAHGVYRFTLGEPLPPGEYALAELVRAESLSVYVWDFGVDAGAPAANPKSK